MPKYTGHLGNGYFESIEFPFKVLVFLSYIHAPSNFSQQRVQDCREREGQTEKDQGREAKLAKSVPLVNDDSGDISFFTKRVSGVTW